MSENKQEKPKIIVDDDWKAQAQAEKEKLANEVDRGKAPAAGAAGAARPERGRCRSLRRGRGCGAGGRAGGRRNRAGKPACTNCRRRRSARWCIARGTDLLHARRRGRPSHQAAAGGPAAGKAPHRHALDARRKDQRQFVARGKTASRPGALETRMQYVNLAQRM